MKTTDKAVKLPTESTGQSTLGPVLDFGGTLAPSQCACGFGRRETRQVSQSFDNTPKAYHDPFKHKPPSCPSLF